MRVDYTDRTVQRMDLDDFIPKKKISHEIGCDLSLLSVAELEGRIALMREEIVRLEVDISAKKTSKSAAEQFFKK